jgi:hypothetical protein
MAGTQFFPNPRSWKHHNNILVFPLFYISKVFSFPVHFAKKEKKLMMIKCSKKRSKFDTSIQEVGVKKEEEEWMLMRGNA